MFSKGKKKILILMKDNDCLFSNIQNLCNAVSGWLIKKINNPVETNETISCACCHIVLITAEPVKHTLSIKIKFYGMNTIAE